VSLASARLELVPFQIGFMFSLIYKVNKKTV
jgi:hypothetical protein